MATIWGSATGSNSDRVNVWIDWWEDAPDYANNRSYVHAAFYAQTKSDQSSTTYDNNGNSNFYVNGGRVSGIVNGSINFRSASPHNRPKNILGTWEGWVSRDGNGNANITFSGNFSLSSSYISGGSAGGTVSLSTIWTGAGAPSSPRFDQNPYENTLTFRWNAGSGGVNNAIVGYHIYFRINYGGEQVIAVGVTTYHNIDTLGWGRGTVVDFHLAAITQRGDNPWSGWSGSAYKNRVPNTPTNASMSKAFYAPGETMRINFTNNGDPDGNLREFEAVNSSTGQVVGRNQSAAATYVDIPTTGWTPGVNYSFCVRAYDTLSVPGGWSGVATAMLGLPAFIRIADGTFRRVASMRVNVPGQGFRQVKSMKIAPVQGAINRTVF